MLWRAGILPIHLLGMSTVKFYEFCTQISGSEIPNRERKREMDSGIGKRLQKFRKARGLSVGHVAEKIGVAESTYRDWEYGRAIKGEPYTKIAEALGVSLSALLMGEQTKDKLFIIKELEKIESAIESIRTSL